MSGGQADGTPLPLLRLAKPGRPSGRSLRVKASTVLARRSMIVQLSTSSDAPAGREDDATCRADDAKSQQTGVSLGKARSTHFLSLTCKLPEG
jgi:hypothetical protein